MGRRGLWHQLKQSLEDCCACAGGRHVSMVMEMVNVNVVCASSSASDLLESGVIIMMST